MSSDRDSPLAQALRRELGPLEPRSVPDFARTWSQARLRAAAHTATATAARGHAQQSRSWRPALAFAAAVGVAAFGVVQWQHARHEDTRLQAADLALAVHVASANGFAVPTDSLLRAGPDSLFRGAPALPEIEYPLMPKESLL